MSRIIGGRLVAAAGRSAFAKAGLLRSTRSVNVSVTRSSGSPDMESAVRAEDVSDLKQPAAPRPLHSTQASPSTDAEHHEQALASAPHRLGEGVWSDPMTSPSNSRDMAEWYIRREKLLFESL